MRAQNRSVPSVPMCSGWKASHDDLAQNSTRCDAGTALVSIINVIAPDVSVSATRLSLAGSAQPGATLAAVRDAVETTITVAQHVTCRSAHSRGSPFVPPRTHPTPHPDPARTRPSIASPFGRIEKAMPGGKECDTDRILAT